MKFLLYLIILTLLIFSVSAQCIKPTDSLVINKDTIFCEGTYNLPNGIVIGIDNISLDCDNAIIEGLYISRGITIEGKNNVVIKNCNINTYKNGIYLESSIKNSIQNNVLFNNIVGIKLSNSFENLIINNQDNSTIEAIDAINSKFNIIKFLYKSVKDEDYCNVNVCDEIMEVSPCEDGDGYCSPGCNKLNDNDCGEEKEEEIIEQEEITETEINTQIPEEKLEDYIKQIIEVEYRDVKDKSIIEKKFKNKYWLAKNNTNISTDSFYNKATNRTVITVMIKPNATLINYSVYIFMSKCMIEYVKHIIYSENLSATVNSTAILFRENLSVDIQNEDVQLKIPIGDLTETKTIIFEVPDDIMIKGCKELYKILGVGDKIIPLKRIGKEVETPVPPKTLAESIKELFIGSRLIYVLVAIAIIALIIFIFKSKQVFLLTEKFRKGR